MTLETWLKTIQTSVILLQRHPKPYKLLILQFDRKTEKYFKDRVYMVFGDAITKLQRRLYESLTMFQGS